MYALPMMSTSMPRDKASSVNDPLATRFCSINSEVSA